MFHAIPLSPSADDTAAVSPTPSSEENTLSVMHRIGWSVFSSDSFAKAIGISNDIPSCSLNVEMAFGDSEATRAGSSVVMKTKTPGCKTGVIPEIIWWAVRAMSGILVFHHCNI